MRFLHHVYPTDYCFSLLKVQLVQEMHNEMWSRSDALEQLDECKKNLQLSDDGTVLSSDDDTLQLSDDDNNSLFSSVSSLNETTHKGKTSFLYVKALYIAK